MGKAILNGLSDIHKMIINFRAFHLLISFVLLLDVYLIIIFNFGFMNLDIPVLYNIKNIKHIFFFSIFFGITFHQVSVSLYVIFYKPFTSCRNKSDNNNSIYYTSLKEQAIEKENNFLMDYVKDESKRIIKIKKNYQVMYTLLISIIINFSVNNSILRNILKIFYLNNINNFIRFYFGIIMLSIIVTVLYSVYYSIAFDEEKIYYKSTEMSAKTSPPNPCPPLIAETYAPKTP